MNNSLAQLIDHIEIPVEQLNLDQNSKFAFKAPSQFIELIETANPEDPLLKQVLPVQAEQQISDEFKTDPVGDLLKNPSPSLIHKYQGRALLIASPKCDIHCRYCFRRHFPYEQQTNQRHWQQALKIVKEDESIHELILSGGDPMSLSESALMKLINAIEEVPQLTTLRIHSRTPIVATAKAPQKAFIDWVKHTHLKVVLVVHCNHANELSEQSAALLRLYRDAGITLLNQSVLLKGINDDAQSLQQLSHKLFQQGVLPYYLHQLDKVQGASHFLVEDEIAKQLIENIRKNLPGYLVPNLVREIAGEPYKTPVV